MPFLPEEYQLVGVVVADSCLPRYLPLRSESVDVSDLSSLSDDEIRVPVSTVRNLPEYRASD